ncbi:tyrosine-protein phosphatase [Paenibacillus sp. JDR-2]|uniref:tyrosine-protein phosphatase n=1 Tax=Paenibacillus sp. (strain JDR-2) TaxID=324057 RepID=UPI000166AD7B|nr:tyrosine-protein phosphatase [Paenibacillus sp. JDR-2]ACT04620.1 protein tyrosine/serine phosphatase [Paenibacillus sp. JDR-2]
MTTNQFERIVPMERVLNFRDMGGYKTNDGREVKPGLIFRSADLSAMTEKDIALLRELNITAIFDYRDDHESEKQPDPAIPSVKNIRVPAINNPAMTSADFEKDMVKLMDQMSLEQMTKMYGVMPLNNPSFKALIQLFEEQEGAAFLHHCMGGRDRTGVGAALILTTLGVDRGTIIADYLISNETLAPMNDQLRERMKPHLPEEKIEELMEKMRLREEFLVAVFNAIEESYGTFEAYLEQEFGINAERRAKLQSHYLA